MPEIAPARLGDALSVLPEIEKGSASIVALDPPYSMVPNAVRGRDDGAAGTNGSPVMLLSEVFAETRRILRPGGIAPTVCDWRRLPDVTYMATVAGLRVATCVAWTRKRIGTGGLLRSSWDPILVLSNGTPKAVDRAAIPNVVLADPPSKRCHPYEKPVEMWAHIFRRVPTGLVVDPFCGSASSAVAAAQTGHDWVGFDAVAETVDAANTRIGQLLQDSARYPAPGSKEAR